MSGRAEEGNQLPLIIEKNGRIVNLNEEFLELSGFSFIELLGKSFITVWTELLRINIDPCSIDTRQEGFLFTKSLQVRCVNIEAIKNNRTSEVKYLIEEISNSRFDEKFPYVNYLHHSNKSGSAIYSVPDLILLKANQTYLNFYNEPFNRESSSFGKTKRAKVDGFVGSETEKVIMNICKTGEVLALKELEYQDFQRGTTYWDTTFVPVVENGVIKYLLEVSHEVTEIVQSRIELEEQNRIIKQQKKELEAIIKNISDGLAVIDKQGQFILVNDSVLKIMEKKTAIGDIVNCVGETLERGQIFYDESGNQLAFTDLPSARVLRGETVEKQRVIVKNEIGETHLDFHATPVLDDKGEFHFGVITSHDVTDLVYSQNKLKLQHEEIIRIEKEKNEVLENAMKLKNEFLYLITHEFKTPLAVISSALQTMDLVCKEQMPIKANKFLDAIRQNTNRQLRLVNNLLDITRLNAGHIKLNKNNFDIVYVTQSIVKSVEMYAQMKKITVAFKSNFTKKEILIDEEKFERILLNLLSNALKFTPNGKSINVTLTSKKYKNKSMICINVQDEGIGIPKDRQEHIFERFGQADTTLSRHAEGTGIGLHLVKLLVNAFDGCVTVESEEGVGSTFTILLPATKAKHLDEMEQCHEVSSQFMSNNHRIVQAALIEFSDIYLD